MTEVKDVRHCGMGEVGYKKQVSISYLDYLAWLFHPKEDLVNDNFIIHELLSSLGPSPRSISNL